MLFEIAIFMYPATQILGTDMFLTCLMRRKCEYVIINLSLFCNPTWKKMVYRYMVMLLAEVALVSIADVNASWSPQIIGIIISLSILAESLTMYVYVTIKRVFMK